MSKLMLSPVRDAGARSSATSHRGERGAAEQSKLGGLGHSLADHVPAGLQGQYD
jgi:hypothetical protein